MSAQYSADLEQMSAQYSADLDAMLIAACTWKLMHPMWETELQFIPLKLPNLPPGNAVIIAALDADLVRRLSGNAATAELLTLLDKAAAHGGGASLLQAEGVIEHVFGIAHFARPASMTGAGKVDA